MTPIKEWLFFSRAIFRALLRKSPLITILMCVVLLGSAVAVVYSAHHNRQLFAELKRLQLKRDAYQMEWSQLLLEQSAWSAHGRIEYIAITKLDMKIPESKDFVVIE